MSLCRLCQKRPRPLSGRRDTCRLCDRGVTRKARLRPREKAVAYQGWLVKLQARRLAA